MARYNIFGTDQRMILQYKGIFNFQKLYSMIAKWYQDRNYEFHETNYKMKPDTEEMELYWQGWRDDTDYIRVTVDLYMHVWDLQDIEAIKNGKKLKMAKARFRVFFRGRIDTDAEGRWGGTPFFEALRDFYDKYIFKKRLDMYINKIENETHGFVEMFKKELGMEAKSDVFKDSW
ncbi:MAG: hypothetical protein ABH879_02060 [archaeon]